jgi:uncharacterized protein
MTENNQRIFQSGSDVLITVVVQAGAKEEKVVGFVDGALKVKVRAQRERGRANAALEALLAESFDVPRSAIILELGETVKMKRIRIKNCSVEKIMQHL